MKSRQVDSVPSRPNTLSVDLPTVVRVRPNEPDPEGVWQAIGRIGYKLEEALADLVDNSLDAKASVVMIRFFHQGDVLNRIAIVDNGGGIPDERFDECMQFGARIRHKESDLGKYGIGLKAASFSQCRNLSVVSRVANIAAGRRWTADSVRQGWLCEELDAVGCQAVLKRDWRPVIIRSHGTAVIWSDIDKIRTEQSGIDAVVNRIFRTVPVHLGMVFHRFLASGSFRVVMDTVDESNGQAGPPCEIRALDPFAYKRSGKSGYPHKVVVTFEGLPLTLRCHIWPPKATEPEYKLGQRAAHRQGFYFYRNGRLIQAGGWNGWRDEDSEPHMSLARVQVDLPTELDAAWGLNVQKSSVDVGPGFGRLLDKARDGVWSLKQFVKDADAVYRDAQPVLKDGPIVPGTGIPHVLRSFIAEYFSDGRVPPRKVAITWRRLAEGVAFTVDREHMQLIFNTRYRSALTAVDSEVMVKLLTFLLFRDEFNRERVRAARSEWLSAVNEMVMVALGGRR